jgi:opacity protein-like surface antigen
MRKAALIISPIIVMAVLAAASPDNRVNRIRVKRTPPFSLGLTNSGQVVEEYDYESGNLFSGFFIRFGWLAKPKTGGLGDSWTADLGYDFGLSRNFAFGLEIQPAFRSHSMDIPGVASIDIFMVPVMGFANIKGGLTVFRHFSPFLGGGIGTEASYTSTKAGTKTFNDFQANLAYHALAGVEVRLSGINLIAEGQLTRVSDPAVDPDSWRYFLLFGFRF